MAIIIYAHGFNSGPGAKVKQLEASFPEHTVLSPQLPYDPEQAISILENILEENADKPIRFVGTSLGGFYGLCLASRHYQKDIFFYLINTALMPHLSLSRYLHTTVTNFVTSERYFIDQTILEKYKKLYRIMYAQLNGTTLQKLRIFQGSRDDLVNHDELRQLLKAYETPVQISTHDQDHRFEDITPVIETIHSDFE
jgi:uncharacterized protein